MSRTISLPAAYHCHLNICYGKVGVIRNGLLLLMCKLPRTTHKLNISPSGFTQFVRDSPEFTQKCSTPFVRDSPEFTQKCSTQFVRDSPEFTQKRSTQFVRDSPEFTQKRSTQFVKDSPEFTQKRSTL